MARTCDVTTSLPQPATWKRRVVDWVIAIAIIGTMAQFWHGVHDTYDKMAAELTAAKARTAALEAQVDQMLKSGDCGHYFGNIGGMQVYVRPMRRVQ